MLHLLTEGSDIYTPLKTNRTNPLINCFMSYLLIRRICPKQSFKAIRRNYVKDSENIGTEVFSIYVIFSRTSYLDQTGRVKSY